MAKRPTDGHRQYVVPTLRLAPYTLIFDRERQRQVMRVRGLLPLPVGAEIELLDPNVSATVIHVRLLAGDSDIPPSLCLDVSVPQEYWDRDEEEVPHG